MSDQISKLQDLAATQLGMKTPQIKPLIMLPGGGVQISDTARNIYKLAGARNGLYYSNGLVVQLGETNSFALPMLTHLEPAAARSEFEKYARFGKVVSKNGAEGVLSESDAKAILLSHVAKEELPRIRSLLNRPIPMLRNGNIEILHEGYNPNVELLVAGGSIEEPATIEEAVRLIESVVMDFKFQSESDKSRAIASMLTPALKLGGFIKDHTPIFIVEANESQTGKGYLLHLRSLIYGEVAVVIAQQKKGVGGLDERFGSAILTGRPFIQLDNIRGRLDSQTLESFLTSPGLFSIRTPLLKEQYIDGSNKFVAITSNGLEMTEDLANRAIFVRLEKEAGREFSSVNGKLIDELIKSLQPHYIGAITKIIRHWFAEGMPRTDEKRHDRREWAQSLDWIVQNIFHLPPLLDGHAEAQQRVQNPALVFMREVVIQVEKVGRLGEEFRAQELADVCETGGVEIPGLNKKGLEGYTEKQEAQRIGQLMAQAFGERDELLIEPYRIIRRERLGLTSVGNSYSGKRYTFERITEQPAEQTIEASTEPSPEHSVDPPVDQAADQPMDLIAGPSAEPLFDLAVDQPADHPMVPTEEAAV